MLPDQVSNPGPLTYEPGALPIALRGPAADSVDPDQIALEQYEQGLHCLPVILLNAHNTLIQKQKVNVQALKS